MSGPAVVRCPACGKDRWRGIGPCGNCGAPAVPDRPMTDDLDALRLATENET